MNNTQEIKEEIYRIIDSFLVEAKDQDGNERSVEQLNRDRHLAAERFMELCLNIKQATLEECIEMFEKLIVKYHDKKEIAPPPLLTMLLELRSLRGKKVGER